MENKKGFFLSETIVVLTIVAVVLLGVFAIYSDLYSKYRTSEKYNTPSSILALSAMQNYYDSKINGKIENLLDDEVYIDLTENAIFSSEYYNKLKEVYEVDNIYLMDLDAVENDADISSLNAVTRKYIETIKNKGGVVLILNCRGNEFSSSNIFTTKGIELVGDENEEYAVYLHVNGTFIDPGYMGTDIVPEITCEEGKTGCNVTDNVVTLDTSTAKKYYLYYDFEGFMLRRKVEVTSKTIITFDANDGEVIPTHKLIVGGNVYGTLPIPTYEGHTFLGWFTLENGGTEVTDSLIVPTNDITLYAHWS